MSLIIKDMEMPKNCFKCKLSRMTPSMYAFCSLNVKCYSADDAPPPDCPLVPVPPHGRLIDADALVDCLATLLQFPSNLVNGQWIVNTLREQPTIIPAEEGETCQA